MENPSRRSWTVVAVYEGPDAFRVVFSTPEAFFAVVKCFTNGKGASLKFWRGVPISRVAMHWKMKAVDAHAATRHVATAVSFFREIGRTAVRYPLQFYWNGVTV